MKLWTVLNLWSTYFSIPCRFLFGVDGGLLCQVKILGTSRICTHFLSSSLLGSIIARSRNWVNDPWARRHHEGGFLVKECKWVKICEILTQRILQEFLLLFSTPQTLFYKFLTPLWSKSSKSHNFYAHICWHDPMHNGHRGAIFERKKIRIPVLRRNMFFWAQK